MKGSEDSPQTRLCSVCGEANPREFEVCWKCQGDLAEVEAASTVAVERSIADDAEPELFVADESKRRVVLPAPVELERRGLGIEILVVLAVGWLPLFVRGILVGREPWDRDAAQVFGIIAYEIGLIALVLYLAWQRAGTFRDLGLRGTRWWRELVFGLGILIAIVVVSGVAAEFGYALDLPGSGTVDRSGEATRVYLAFIPLGLLLAAFSEELFFRAYLLTRLGSWLGSDRKALFLSAALFSACHGYKATGSLGIFIGGLALGWIFLTWRSLPRLVIGHWLFNVLIEIQSAVPIAGD